ncbi:ATP-dependent DNA helicase DinG [Orenia metallireducens]|uniref:ATP-dependent DNA helicase DinG n=1 Tax=Orenia metallireducens TaxID=1413210 RepID=A0A285FLS5_9FIRM|nr:helicase C-terminal domain-containing protein [Orenia metallireducens]PRX33617.1 ATP-dependent DNA helicase DinG [Orenia metallireducens]SNY12165.1 ATP-dependent DNA helicase DinG [Orenia metallireducens]
MNQKEYLQEVSDFFAPGNRLDSYFDKYEYRPEQQEMSVKIAEVFSKKEHLLVEAGTGTGKSLAYLVPSILMALKEEEKVIISTNTINLQEQLIKKDIPLLQEIFNLDFKAVLVKGRKNYICIRRLVQFGKSAQLDNQGYNTLSKVHNWVLETETGCRSDLDFRVDYNIWDNISSESDLCLRAACPYYEQCHFIFARDEAQEADILVVNHHILFADLSLRQERGLEGENAVLPPYKQVIFDEAHNIEEVATSYLGFRVNRRGVIKLVESLYNFDQQTGILLQTRAAISSLKRNVKQNLQQNIDNKLVPLVRKVNDLSHSLFNNLIKFIDNKTKGRDRKLRLLESIRAEDYWQDNLMIEFENLLINLNDLGKNLSELLEDVISYEDEIDEIDAVKLELKAKVESILKVGADIAELVNFPEEDYVYWLEGYDEDCSLHSAPINIAQQLQDNLLGKMDSVVLTSATLTVDKSFEFIKDNLGLIEEDVETLEVGSPFDYRNQLCLGVAKDLPQPNHPAFIDAVIASVKEIIQATKGRTLVLFTSYGMLNKVYNSLETQLDSLEVNNIYCQGMKSRQYLVEEFKNKKKAVLLGTSSFWEGVDIPGEELSCVVIAKLPFVVPSEPVISAKLEKLEAASQNSFMKYMVPKAVIKFKQGFGRLIRTKEDKGWIVILDNRVITKRYGKIFLKSLPSGCNILTDNLNSLTDKIRASI